MICPVCDRYKCSPWCSRLRYLMIILFTFVNTSCSIDKSEILEGVVEKIGACDKMYCACVVSGNRASCERPMVGDQVQCFNSSHWYCMLKRNR